MKLAESRGAEHDQHRRAGVSSPSGKAPVIFLRGVAGALSLSNLSRGIMKGHELHLTAGFPPPHFHTGTKKTRSTLLYSTRDAGDPQIGQISASCLSTFCTSGATPPKKKKNTIFLCVNRDVQHEFISLKPHHL